MKVQDVKNWMKEKGFTQDDLAQELGYSHRVTIANNLRKELDEVSPEFLGRLLRRFPETVALLAPAAQAEDQPECA